MWLGEDEYPMDYWSRGGGREPKRPIEQAKQKLEQAKALVDRIYAGKLEYHDQAVLELGQVIDEALVHLNDVK